MKLFYIVSLLLLLGGCTTDITEELDLPVNKDGSIAFLTDSVLTRGRPQQSLTSYSQLNLLTYRHKGKYASGKSLYRKVALTKSGSGWDYTPRMFWPDDHKLSFLSYASDVAYASASGQPGVFIKDNGLTTAPTIEYIVPKTVTQQPDLLVTALLDQDQTKNVVLPMKHALACVSFCATGLPAMRVKSITLQKVYSRATLALDNTSLAWTIDPNSKGVTTFEPGTDPDKPLTDTPTDKNYLMTADGYLMMIPQTLTDASIDVVYWRGKAGTEITISYILPTTVVWEPGQRYVYQFGEPTEEVVVYYEKYADNSYGFQSKNLTLALLNETKTIIEAGYGVLSKSRVVGANPTIKLGANPAVAATKVASVSGDYNLYAVSQSATATLPLSKTSLAPVEVYFNDNNASCGKIVPHFAKGVSDWNISPYTIRTPQQMRNLSVVTVADPWTNATAGQTFKQERDLDFAVANKTIGGGALSTPVVDETFSGTYNGNSKTISNVSITAPGLNYVGLFSQSIGQINDVVLKSSTISGNDYVGGIIGYIYGQTAAINRPRVIGTTNTATGRVEITGGNWVGGIVGFNQSTLTGNPAVDPVTGITVAEVSGWVNITGRGNYVGGIAGYSKPWDSNGWINTVLVYGVFVTGTGVNDLTPSKITITGKDYVGGIVGWNEGPIKGNVTGSGATVKNMPDVGGVVEIRGASGVGGIAGLNAATGTLNSVNIRLGRVGPTIIAGTGDNVGGIVGDNRGKLGTESNDTFISARGNISISGSNNVGGIVGVNGSGAELANCFVCDYFTRTGAQAFFAPRIVCATNNVGGIAGANSSAISNCSVFSASNTATSLVTISAGSSNAGGIAGLNTSGSETKNCSLVGKVIVEGKVQSAGGIFGDNKSGSKITNCWVGGSDGNNIIKTAQTTLGLVITPEGVSTPSYGIPAITGNSYIGGIVGLNNGGVIDGILLSDNVTIGRAETDVNNGSNWVGGIVGGNTPSYMGQTNVIKNCRVVNTTGKSVVVQGSTNLGGIAGLNNGVIDNCTVSGTQTAPFKIIGLGTIGGIVGQNGGHGELAQTGNDYTIISNSRVTGYVTLQGNPNGWGIAVAVGGIVGLNGPTKDVINNVSRCVVQGAAAGSIAISVYGTTGGIVGTNSGNLLACDVQNATITSKGYYAGGITGQTTLTALSFKPPSGFCSNMKDCRIYSNVAIKGESASLPGALIGYLDSQLIFVLGVGAPNLVNATGVTVNAKQPTQGVGIIGFATGDGSANKPSVNHTVTSVAPR